ncbi:hypothetical protein [Citrobacter cronae]|uniref:hypothetical protein n=1 Tax=Citrobacter cronae TaxID=1748967 RepID=UPI001C117E69|nr:hypothetical protein [Citrobacter cronae]MBU5384854.1 hypothetical protein [Citrobacter cronae]
MADYASAKHEKGLPKGNPFFCASMLGAYYINTSSAVIQAVAFRTTWATYCIGSPVYSSELIYINFIWIIFSILSAGLN